MKALIIGINYNSKHKLKGCINDANLFEHWLRLYTNTTTIYKLTDDLPCDDVNYPTKDNILKVYNLLIQDASSDLSIGIFGHSAIRYGKHSLVVRKYKDGIDYMDDFINTLLNINTNIFGIVDTCNAHYLKLKEGNRKNKLIFTSKSHKNTTLDFDVGGLLTTNVLYYLGQDDTPKSIKQKFDTNGYTLDMCILASNDSIMEKPIIL